MTSSKVRIKLEKNRLIPISPLVCPYIYQNTLIPAIPLKFASFLTKLEHFLTSFDEVSAKKHLKLIQFLESISTKSLYFSMKLFVNRFDNNAK